jgi:hypothetical protein
MGGFMDPNTTRLKTKIGDHEFDAEGSPEYVREQFQAWQELVKLAVSIPAVTPHILATQPADGQPIPPKNDGSPLSDQELVKIMRVDGRYVSLTARATTVHDAVLLMLYGQKVLRNNEAVTGAELLSGLGSTGGFPAPRLDRILDKLATDGDVMSFGERRGKKYRLTNTGSAKARALATDLITAVA